MARSSYIYVVDDDGHPVAAFTVKHELVSYLREVKPAALWFYSVHRLRDGLIDRVLPVHLPMEELLS